MQVFHMEFEVNSEEIHFMYLLLKALEDVKATELYEHSVEYDVKEGAVLKHRVTWRRRYTGRQR